MSHGNLGYILGCVIGAALMVLAQIPWPDPGPNAHWRFHLLYPFLPAYVLGVPLVVLSLIANNSDGLTGAFFVTMPWVMFALYKTRNWAEAPRSGVISRSPHTTTCSETGDPKTS